MAENLNTSIYRNGEAIATNLSGQEWGNTINNQQGAWTNYNNDESYACPYGKLYNWFACVDSRQLCPVGWHVPTDEEWSALILLLDPAYNPNEFFSSSDVAGIEMKSAGAIESGNGYWYAYPQIVSTNSSGFSGFPSGRRWFFDGSYSSNGLQAFMWSSTQYGEYGAYYRKLCYDGNGAYRSDEGHKSNGYSVRCVHD
jgi:uncharacterized protein (TIGR02145 family)